MAVTERGRRTEYEELTPLFDELTSRSSSETERDRIRSRLVTEHLPVAEHIARRFRNRGQPEDDLRQVATIGLINAVDRFDPERGNDFLSFAVPTITGEVRRYFRDATWSLRVPRRLKELHTALTSASAQLGQQLGRSPRPSELAAELNVPVEEVYEGLRVGYAYNSESLDESSSGGAEGRLASSSQLGIEDDDLSTVEDREALYPALAKLPEREAKIVVMRFFGNMTQSQIAERVGISQMHVSRLLTSSLQLLREILSEEESDRVS
ncbi:MAG TPA: SigB/SigF/SigG family RNA polymerase sigma factor [Pseudonocardiaceae bacterium]|nr:SigB/SigF/SigG family RNA polymerase sigma factor [Pseudonocardiaceae bacterium]